jgi:hypothetical protein
MGRLHPESKSVGRDYQRSGDDEPKRVDHNRNSDKTDTIGLKPDLPGHCHRHLAEMKLLLHDPYNVTKDCRVGADMLA